MNQSLPTASESVIGLALNRFHQSAEHLITVNNADKPTIIGGRFAQPQLATFLALWRKGWSGTPYVLQETISQLAFTIGFTPAIPADLERLTIFDMAGHLTLRRDAGRWFWHYIGTDEPQQRPAPFDQATFWQPFWEAKGNDQVRLYWYDETVLLWGKKVDPTSTTAPVANQKQSASFFANVFAKFQRTQPKAAPAVASTNTNAFWWEDRVAAATLIYPELGEHERVALQFRRYTQGGQTVFVWYRALIGQPAFDQSTGKH